MEVNHCPWCGKDLIIGNDQCTSCGWNRAGTQKNRSVKVYVGFLIVSLLVAGGFFAYALKYVMAPTNHLAKTNAIHFEKP